MIIKGVDRLISAVTWRN